MTPDPPAPPVLLKPSELVQKYLLLRERKEQIKERHTQELAPLNVAMNAIENMLLEVMNANGQSNFKVAGIGTAYTSTTASVKVEDWSVALPFIIANQRWDLLEARVNKTAAQSFIEETQAAIPGVKVTREIGVNIRKS